MPFTWTENIDVGTKLTPAQANEIKTKTDSTATTIGISPWSWSTTVTSGIAVDKQINTNIYTELRQAIDYVYDNRTCASHYSSNCPTNNSTQNSSYKSTVYDANRATEHSSNCGAYDGSVNGTNRSTENSTVYSGNNYAAHSGQNSSVAGSNSTVNSSNRSPYNSSYLSSVNGTHRASVNYSYKSSDYRLKNIFGIINNASYYLNNIDTILGSDLSIAVLIQSIHENKNKLVEVTKLINTSEVL